LIEETIEPVETNGERTTDTAMLGIKARRA
jgi:hypothetical protein